MNMPIQDLKIALGAAMLASVSLLGCGDFFADSSDATSSGSGDATEDGESFADSSDATSSGSGDANENADRGAYPAGPFGGNVDQVLPNLTFTSPDGSSLDFQAIRDTAGSRYLFINTAAFWCGACIEEQPTIASLHNDYASRGLETLVTVFETADQTPADAGDAGRWLTSYQLPFRVVADTDASMTDFYDSRSTPLNMLVDLSSMEVLYRSTGTDVDAVRQLVAVLLGN
jgi:thiol-disulfide isomerase/thioredoxin